MNESLLLDAQYLHDDIYWNQPRPKRFSGTTTNTLQSSLQIHCFCLLFILWCLFSDDSEADVDSFSSENESRDSESGGRVFQPPFVRAGRAAAPVGKTPEALTQPLRVDVGK